MGAPRHGKNGLIYISGTEIEGANAWAIDVTQDSIETPQFGDTWKKRVVGHADWSGSITAWDHNDVSTLFDAACAGAHVALLIYPVRSDLTDYYSGNAIFGMSSGGGSSAAVSATASFVGDDTLAQTGWT